MVTQRVSDTGALTAVHLSLVAILAILTVLAIVWGARLKRKRRAADEAEAARVEAKGGELPSPTEAARPLEEPSATTRHAVEDRAAAAVPGATAPDTSATPPREATAKPVTPDASASSDTPIAAAAPLDAAPASEAEPARADDAEATPSPVAAEPIANPSSFADEPVTRLKGLGPKVAARLEEHGITTVGQIAVLDATAAERLDARLGPFTGRMGRDRWIEQARFLAAGDRAGYEAVFGKL